LWPETVALSHGGFVAVARRGMTPPMSERRPPRRIHVEMPNYIIRTVERADATGRWCNWLLDPAAIQQLNTKPKLLSLPELEAYIARFDGVSSHLIGIFEKTTGRIVGMRSIYVDHAKREFLDNILIGEPDARGKTARSESTEAVLPIFFEEMDLLASRCSIMADNAHMLALVARKGWALERIERKAAASGSGTRELHHFRLTRETWRARRQS
jgi:RimJ/RimL family protein N-acetyltransferase